MAGIVINLLSAYLKSPLDGSLSRMSRWWASRSQARRSTTGHIVDELRRSRHQQLLYAWRHTRQLMFTILYLLLGIFFMVAIQVFALPQKSLFTRAPAYFIASVCYLLALRSLLRAATLVSILSDATKADPEPKASNQTTP
jgi:hypothetical protein